MTQDVEFACRCNEVHGWLKGVAPATVNRIVCYCDDCQAYVHYLDRAELLDAHAGSDVVQVAPRALSFDRGTARIVGLRLTPKGLFRWYSKCCNTPLGNTLTPAIPFVGIYIQLLRPGTGAGHRDEVFGTPLGASMVKFAVGGPPPDLKRVRLGQLVHPLGLVLGWKLTGKGWPHPFFDRTTGAPGYPLTVLSPAEREALSAKCGPKPAS